MNCLLSRPPLPGGSNGVHGWHQDGRELAAVKGLMDGARHVISHISARHVSHFGTRHLTHDTRV